MIYRLEALNTRGTDTLAAASFHHHIMPRPAQQLPQARRRRVGAGL
jgi:hypothetical protein